MTSQILTTNNQAPCASNSLKHAGNFGTSFIISAGFLAVFLLTITMVGSALYHLNSANSKMEILLTNTHKKLQLTYNMREAIRLRSKSFYRLFEETDPFILDEEILRFSSYAGDFIAAREKLDALTPSPREQMIQGEVRKALHHAQPLTDRVATLLTKGANREQLKTAMKQAEIAQSAVLSQLDQLVEAAKAETTLAIENSRTEYFEARDFLFTLTLILLAVSGVIAYLVVKQASVKNKQILHQATHDSLTHLINRKEFERLLNDAVTNAATERRQHALLYLDLDQFKVVNDTCGHMAGDELLCQLTAILNYSLRKGDTLARLGGDEFGILLNNCRPTPSTHVADQLLEATRNFRFVWSDKIFTVSASIGIFPIDRYTRNTATALSAADAACYTAKDSGRNRYHIYEKESSELQQNFGEMNWVAKITEALEQNKFQLFFQPINPVNPGDNSLEPHCEILIRMKQEDGKLAPPGAFLPAAERFGLSTALDRWVIGATFDWINRHSQRIDRLGVFSINLSGTSLGDSMILEYITSRLASAQFDPSAICFEITETAAISNISMAREFIEILQTHGCRFALDDFGSGLSSFAYLKQLPVDYLKIDGTFVRDIANDPLDLAMVNAINQIGKIMGKKTIAEFVEDQITVEHLKDIGVDYVQGYHIGKPQPLEFSQLLRSRTQEQLNSIPA